MATVIGSISMSHSPLWNLAPDPEAGQSGSTFVEAVDRAAELLALWHPDAIVLFGPDHARGVFYDLLPPFTVGVERVEGVGDYHTPSGELPVPQGLARQVFDGVTSAGFDPALSLSLRIDHGLTQVYSRLVRALDVPMIPVIVNSGCPPLPTFRRCWDFGAAVGEAIQSSNGAERVVTIGSGGMSHWPASIDAYDPGVTPEWRDFLVNGRPRVDEVEVTRVARAQALANGHGTGPIADRWDADLLDRLARDPAALGALDDEDVVALAGPGACELRTWAAATAAWGGDLGWTAYEAVPRWITGMGLVASGPGPTVKAV